MDGQEIEVKFFVHSLPKIEGRLQDSGVRLIQPRTLEINRRFDHPDGRLRASGQVLRLRQDRLARLTFKGRGTSQEGVLSRTELEVTVSDAEAVRQMLEALGFVQSAIYEKYRRVYELGGCEIMLDELPYGDFVEIEGPDTISIRAMTHRLGLKIEHAVEQSYLGIFERYCIGRRLDPTLLTFEALKGNHPTPKELGVEGADQ